jgi:CDGSH-type Zn-finger protein
MSLSKPDPYAVQLEPGKDYYYCACGLSKSQPFCDGSHKGTSFKPLKFTVDEKKIYYMCGCRESSNAPFCDGTHSKEKGVKKYNKFLLQRNIELSDKLERSKQRFNLLSIATGVAVVAFFAKRAFE